jgi:hypothetical protein
LYCFLRARTKAGFRRSRHRGTPSEMRVVSGYSRPVQADTLPLE